MPTARLKGHVRVLETPTRKNVIAMAAPSHGRGVYTEAQVKDLLETALAAFTGAREESRTAGCARCVVHTGPWGTGAFGGNAVLIALVQMLAAEMSGIDALAYATVDARGMRAVDEAKATLESWREASAADASIPFPRLVRRIVKLGLRWGRGNGT